MMLSRQSTLIAMWLVPGAVGGRIENPIAQGASIVIVLYRSVRWIEPF